MAADGQEQKPKKEKRRTRSKTNRMVFNETNVLSLPGKGKQYFVWDGGRGDDEVQPGLHILVTPNGVKSYRSYYRFKNDPKPHSRTLGRVGEVSLADARAMCRQDRKEAARGEDPKLSEQKADEEAKKVASYSFKACVEEYVKREQVNRLKCLRADECQRVLLADTGDWHARPISAIQRKDIKELLELIRDGDTKQDLKERPWLANLFYARLRPFFAWCVEDEKINTNPMLGMKRPWYGNQGRDLPWFKGDLADNAIMTLWQCADLLSDKVEGRFLKCLLLTGKRKTALATMKWGEIDKDWFWHPPQVKKGSRKRLHAIPIPKYMQRIIHPRQATGYVFTGKRDGHVDQKGNSLQKRVIKLGAMDDFILHGCRHIVETKMGELRGQDRRSVIPPWIRDRLLDHAPSRGSGQHYDHNDYRVEMEDALEAWANYVEKLVAPQGVALLK